MSKAEYAVADLREENASLRQRAVRAERILAALREPSFEVVKAAAELITRTTKNFPSRAIRAAVAAAEQEVGRE